MAAHLRQRHRQLEGRIDPLPRKPAPNRIGFDLERIMRTRYRIDTYQKTYFVIDSYEQLMEATHPDFTPIYASLAQQDSIPAGNVLDADTVFNKGTGEGWANDGGRVTLRRR
jgi:phenylalanine-4-hydroxylase